MSARILIKRPVDNRQNELRVETGEATGVYEVLVVPEEEGALDDLEVVGVEAAGEVEEEDFGDLTELRERRRLKGKRTGVRI